MRSELEVDLAHPEAADPAATQRSVLEETIGLQHLVDDLLYLARSDDGAEPRQTDRVDLDDVVLGVVQATRAATDGVVIDSGEVTGAQVAGDRAQLARAVTNLVENAARHATGRVSVALREDGDHAALIVSDDGPGIPPEDRERVFERFTRLDDARTRSGGGAGLGLAITRDIVERHGGTIALAGARGGGTAVTVTLPLGS
jgi:signal transduction histidine kinase